MSEDAKAVVSYLVCVAALVLFFVACHVVRSHWEAEAYTRLTGKQVSTWDAMFLDLRVQEPIQD